jgi:esterase/lipase
MQNLTRGFYQRLFLFVLLNVLVGCSAVEQRKSFRPENVTTAATKIETGQFAFDDGGHAVFYTLNKSLSSMPSATVDTYVFVVGGSGCSSMRYFLPRYFHGLEGESGALRIFLLQKRHVGDFDRKNDHECGRDFVVDDHPQRWLVDHQQFIQFQLAVASRIQHAPRRIVLIGISEGGDIATQLAKTISGVTHLVIIGNGGMQPLGAYEMQLRKHGLSHQFAALKSLQKSPADPDAIENDIGGRTWRYWKELSQLPHTENLLSIKFPIWIAMGRDDDAVPVESALYIENRFNEQGKSNLHMRIYDGADHGLADGQRNNLNYFWYDLDLSMRK